MSGDIPAAFPFGSKFIEVEGSNLHYIEQGTGDPILFLHGNPTSSYLWRNVIPHLVPRGRCIALDLIGMGKSDKPTLEYRFVDHAKYVEGFISALGLKNITFVIHDWGSALGFHYATRHRDDVKALAFMEAIMVQAENWDHFPERSRELFQKFRTPDVGWELICKQNVFVEQLLPSAVRRDLTEAEMDAYRAPFPTEESRRPVWRWPNEIPIAGKPADVSAIVGDYFKALQEWNVPKLHLHATPGAINPAPVVELVKKSFPNLTSVNIGDGLHFIQEDQPRRIGEEIAAWLDGM